MQRSNTTDSTASFILGGLVGAGLALLFAPRAGSELRSLIGTRVREGADRGRELGERAAQKGRAIIDEARHGLDWQKERMSAAVEAGREAYREEKQ